METLLKLLPYIAAPITLVTAMINLLTAISKTKTRKPMSITALALIAIVAVCAIVIFAICYVVRKA